MKENVKRVFTFLLGMAIAIPVCLVLTAFVQAQLDAMGAATSDTRVWILGILLAVSCTGIVWKVRRMRPRSLGKNRARTVNCFTLDFRP